MQSIIIRKAVSKNDSKKISTLHHRYIDRGFLSSLGTSFLNLMYCSMINSKIAFCIVAEENGKIIGFMSGTTNISKFYIEFLAKNFLKASFILLPKIIKLSYIRKIFETLFYPGKKDSNLPNAELLSIVVEKEYQGEGIAQKLFEKLVEEFKNRNINQFKVVVGSDLIQACKFYEKMDGVLQSEIEVHKGEKSKVYVWRF